MAEDGKIFDSVFFSAKAAEIRFKRLELAGKPAVGEIEFNGMKIEFLSSGEMRISGWGGVEVRDVVVISSKV